MSPNRRQIPILFFALLGACGPLLASEWAHRLADGTHVLLIRHAHAPGVGDPPGFSLDRCETQRLLNDEGRQQAARIGQWLRAQGVVQADVRTSAWCRCRQTAELLGLGPVTVEPSLGSFFAQPGQAAARNQGLQSFIARSLRDKPKGRALVLVTHHVNIREFVGRDIGTGEMVLAHVDRAGRALSHQLYPSP